ncbi:MAG: YwaF family protein [Erysipelotrichaceae bacterium]|nr:YwaF family protein [Erysipelotrichaceae bacterium]
MINFLAEKEFPGVFGIEHIIFMVIAFSLMFFGWIFIGKKVKNEKTRYIITKVSAALLLAAILWNRISITVFNFQNNDFGFENILYMIPLSFCGVSSLITAISTLFLKKDNIVLHFISYIGFIGGLVSTIYPDYLDNQMLLDPRSLSGLTHHAILLWLVVLNIITGYFKPTSKKWFVFELGSCILLTIGVFFKEFDAYLNIRCFAHPMQISQALISSMPILTSWYVVGIVLAILHIVFLIFYERYKNNHTWKEVFSKQMWSLAKKVS